MNAALDESGDKLLLLENLLNERDAKLNELIDEVNELRDSSSWLANELESMISMNEKLASSTTNGAHNLDDDTAGNSGLHHQKRSQLVEQLKQLRLRQRSRIKASEFMLINRRSLISGTNSPQNQPGRRQLARLRPRRQRRQQRRAGEGSLYEELGESSNSNGFESGGSTHNNRSSAGFSSDMDDLDDDIDNDRREWKEALEIYTVLRGFQATLQHRKELLLHGQQQSTGGQQVQAGSTLYLSPTTAGDSGISSADDTPATMDKQRVMDSTGDQQREAAKDPATWRQMLTNLMALVEELPCSSCHVMIGERADYEQLQKVHTRLSDEMRRKEEQLLALQASKTEQDTRLAQLDERCAILSDDLSNCDKPKEEIVKLAWKARDEAVERKNGAEIALAKTRIENMQISSQLMEVVQQKGELSQKLAQFEVSIHLARSNLLQSSSSFTQVITFRYY